MSTPKQVTNWSYSALKTYKQCPLKLKLGRLDKIAEPPSPAMARGSAIHQLAEDFIVQKQKRLPAELAKFKVEFSKLAKTNAHAEEEWAFRRDWTRCSWRAADVWVRMKVDAYYTEGNHLTIIDYKTGKTYAENKGQCSFYALGAFLLFPEIESISVALWYLDSGEVQEDSYCREEVEAMKEWWEYESRVMLADTIFAPRPSYMCKWCFYSKAKGGQCEY